MNRAAQREHMAHLWSAQCARKERWQGNLAPDVPIVQPHDVPTLTEVAPQATLLELRRLEFVLPLPPSCNALYGVGKNGQKYLLVEQRQFRSAVIGIVRGVMREGVRQPLEGRLELRAYFYFANRRRTDTSNRLKALEDALMHGGAYHDDSQIDLHYVARIIRAGEEGCDVLLREIAA